ncbi:hypothetical protein [Celeribacter neptunius]|uniref:Uncharacterized protein n=1 Tax=Celeribacter neptunius TaxID=588602 RepID=A0A1I3LIJ0_9RHOB|nr:hypothetical protein [Celeribacter neptunius]SFI84266.1 hypothetical protein SAMN04487991_1035 [Celeribacter neptunius]
MTNGYALTTFLNDNHIEKDQFGRGNFPADVSLNSANPISAEMTVHFDLFSDFSEHLTLEEVGGFIAGQTPIGFKRDFGEWVHSGKKLTISGNYPATGPYTVEILLK